MWVCGGVGRGASSAPLSVAAHRDALHSVSSWLKKLHPYLLEKEVKKGPQGDASDAGIDLRQHSSSRLK
ncbi:unnamed protein product [Caretta caretta]